MTTHKQRQALKHQLIRKWPGWKRHHQSGAYGPRMSREREMGNYFFGSV